MEDLGKKAFAKIRTIASGDKRRLESEGFDLDLTSMGFPADTLLEQSYRNHIDEVAQYLERTHGDRYMIFNLSDKQYDPVRFGNKVKYMGWPDHHNPPLELLLKVVHAMDEWLEGHSTNVAVVHCKAGLGRTGTAIAAYLLYSGMFTDAQEAMQFFANMRTASCRGVKVPSQRRYVDYFRQILAGSKRPADFRPPKKLVLKYLTMEPVPDIDLIKGGMWPIIEIVYMDKFWAPIYSRRLDRLYVRKRGDRSVEAVLGIDIAGDVLVRIYHEQDLLIGKSYGKLLFRFGFHTSFVENTLTVGVNDLDGPSHGKLGNSDFPPNFRVTLQFAELQSKVDAVPDRAQAEPAAATASQDLAGSSFVTIRSTELPASAYSPQRYSNDAAVDPPLPERRETNREEGYARGGRSPRSSTDVGTGAPRATRNSNRDSRQFTRKAKSHDDSSDDDDAIGDLLNFLSVNVLGNPTKDETAYRSRVRHEKLEKAKKLSHQQGERFGGSTDDRVARWEEEAVAAAMYSSQSGEFIRPLSDQEIETRAQKHRQLQQSKEPSAQQYWQHGVSSSGPSLGPSSSTPTPQVPPRPVSPSPTPAYYPPQPAHSVPPNYYPPPQQQYYRPPEPLHGIFNADVPMLHTPLMPLSNSGPSSNSPQPYPAVQFPSSYPATQVTAASPSQYISSYSLYPPAGSLQSPSQPAGLYPSPRSESPATFVAGEQVTGTYPAPLPATTDAGVSQSTTYA